MATCAGEIMGCNKVFPGQNDLATVRPDVAAKWNYALNGDSTPDKVAWSSGKRAWFHCDVCGQDYDTLISNACKTGCPYCGHKRVFPGVTDFASQFPEIVPEWDTKKNAISPSEVFPFENRKRWWICEKGHSYQKTTNDKVHRFLIGQKTCPYCSGTRVLVGFNDLASVNPDIAEEWHPTKNGKLKPTDVTYGSGRKVWWLCKACGNEYQSYIHHRHRGVGCPICHKGKSVGEEAVKKALLKYGADFREQVSFPDCVHKGQLMFDFVVYKNGEPVIVIEYNGKQHYQPVAAFDKNGESLETRHARDVAKIDWCLKHLIPLMDIRWNQLSVVDDLIRNMLMNLGVLDREKYAFKPGEFNFVPVKK